MTGTKQTKLLRIFQIYCDCQLSYCTVPRQASQTLSISNWQLPCFIQQYLENNLYESMRPDLGSNLRPLLFLIFLENVITLKLECYSWNRKWLVTKRSQVRILQSVWCCVFEQVKIGSGSTCRSSILTKSTLGQPRAIDTLRHKYVLSLRLMFGTIQIDDQ